ncbi:23S rRNA pseudouridine(1911/1915/1917) synthase RluD [Pseudomonas aeruginosa]|nr:23S rRNA pseudouridine(1911/1915/1917) synthase RluD [Pseudomonas aeruginosa]
MIQRAAEVPFELGGQRLDQIAAQLFPEHSRSRLAGWIKDGRLTVDGAVLRPRDIVHSGAQLVLEAEQEAQGEWLAQDIELEIVYEDEHILVIDKPAGLVVHPAAGHQDGTLLNALLYHVPDIANVPRAGIVHRLDKDTTGLMVVAKTLEAHTKLVAQLQARSVSRIYEAIVIGVITSGGTIDAPIGRHGVQRQKMAVVDAGKVAVSHYRVLERFRAHTHTRVKLETGRTHQIRVHMSHIGYPLVGDPVYGGRFRIPPVASQTLVQTLREFPRQALHARFLELDHPATGVRMKWESPLPEDTVLLLSLPKLDGSTQKTKWAKALIDGNAAQFIQVWPVDVHQLPQWIRQRLSQAGLSASPEALELIAARVEGNLLAAAQEIEKLKLLAEGNQIDAATVQAAVADSARFDVFGLIDAALGGEAAHALRILEGLRGEGIEPPVILWGLAREIRLLAGLSQQYGQGIPLEKAFAQARPPVWDKRRPLLTRALQRHSSSRWNQMLRDAQLIDAQIKGQAPGSPWSGLSLLALSLAGQRLGLPAA